MLEVDKKLERLTQLMCYLRSEDFFSPNENLEVENLLVRWFFYTHTWRCVVDIVYKNSSHVTSKVTSSNPLCKYIVEQCFTNLDQKKLEIKVFPPSSYEVVEATYELSKLLGEDVNIEELLR